MIKLIDSIVLQLYLKKATIFASIAFFLSFDTWLKLYHLQKIVPVNCYIYISFFYTRVHGMAQYFQYFQGQFPQHENSQLHMWRVTNPNIVLLLLATLIQ